MAGREPPRYAVVDAFTKCPFKGNPAAVCFLQEHNDIWMQKVAAEFNLAVTSFVTLFNPTTDPPLFHLRWFTPVSEVKLCGHGTLAAAHYIFTSEIVAGDSVEFATESGSLTARKVGGRRGDGGFSIELDFPAVSVHDCDPEEVPSIPLSLNGATVVGVKKAASDDLLIEVSSGEDVSGIQPQFDEIRKCSGRGIMITGPAPLGSGFDFFTRFFCPKLGVNEDPVCGSAHCALAPYWSEKLGKPNLTAYMASPRSGILDLFFDKDTLRVRICGEAVTVMEGFLLA